ncbi:MAG TPA: hypothetical protein VFE24_10915 [Pirellulales bacterium]|jgi:hypothetical protein|nr:hypothetical protein [Pirellulales bacterium]
MSDREPTFESFVGEQPTGYRPVSAWTIVSALLGLAAPVALLDPVLTLVPAVAIGAAAWTLRRMRNQEIAATGRPWVLAGLLAALFFLTAAPARFIVRRRALHERALVFCDQWLAAFQRGRPDLAFALMRPGLGRPALDTPLSELLKNESFKMGYNKFLDRDLVQRLIAGQEGLQCRFDHELAMQNLPDRTGLVEVYEVRLPTAIAPRPLWLQFSVQRSLSDESEPVEEWAVINVGELPVAERQ